MLHDSTDVLENEAAQDSHGESLGGDGWRWWKTGGVKTLEFAECWVHLDLASTYLHTSFRDGASLWSVPVPEKDIVTARAYGYGEDARSLWREHDILHHRVAAAFGLGASPTLWGVAHPDDPRALPEWARREEEVFVAHVHRWLNGGLWHDDLHAFSDQGHDIQALYADFQKLLASLRS